MDIIPYAFAPSAPLLVQLDFTITLRVEDYNLLQQWPKEESRLSAYIRPFSFTVKTFPIKGNISNIQTLKMLLLFLGLDFISYFNRGDDPLYGYIDILSPTMECRLEVDKFHV